MGIKLVCGPQPEVEKDREIELRLKKWGDGSVSVVMCEKGIEVEYSSIGSFRVRGGKIIFDRAPSVNGDLCHKEGAYIQVT